MLAALTDAKGTTFTFSYDDNDRIRQISGGGRLTQITYETGSDHVASMSVDGVAATFEFDAAGRVARRTDTVDGTAFVSQYKYAPTGVIERITYPSQRRVYLDHDGPCASPVSPTSAATTTPAASRTTRQAR